jgi:predicted esterase
MEPAVRLKLINKVFDVNVNNIDINFQTLETTIINQTSFVDASKLKMPVSIIHGTLDPLVVQSNLKDLTKINSNIKLKSVVAGHEVSGAMEKELLTQIKAVFDGKKR